MNFQAAGSLHLPGLMAWLPTIEQSRGIPATTAGIHLSVFLLISAFASLVTGGILHRGPDQRLVSFMGGALMFVTFLGLVLAPDLILLWVLMFGGLCDVSGGGTLPLLVTAGLMAVFAVTGVLAGRHRVIGAPEAEPVGAGIWEVASCSRSWAGSPASRSAAVYCPTASGQRRSA